MESDTRHPGPSLALSMCSSTVAGLVLYSAYLRLCKLSIGSSKECEDKANLGQLAILWAFILVPLHKATFGFADVSHQRLTIGCSDKVVGNSISFGKGYWKQEPRT